MGFAVVGAVVGEYLGAAAGLGYLIQQAEGVFDVAGVFRRHVRAGRFRDRDRHGRQPDREAASGLAARCAAMRGPSQVGQAGLSFAPNGWQGRSSSREEFMSVKLIRRLGVSLAALVLSSGLALAQSKVTLAVGGGSCLCYLPTMLAQALGEYEKAGVNVEIVDFKGGSESLKAVIGGSADVVSGYFDHCVNLAAKGQHLQSFVVYDRYPGLALVVSPKHTRKSTRSRTSPTRKIGVSAPGSSTDFFLKYMLSKNGVDPNSVGVIGVGLGATAVAAMEQGTVDAAIMLDPAVTVLQGQDKQPQDSQRYA